MIEVEGPDGSIIEFPDGTSQDVMAAAMQKKFGAPDDSAARGFGLGVLKPVENATSAMMMIPGMKQTDQFMADTFGTTPYDQIVAEREAARAANSRTGYQMAGNIAGTLPTAAIPGGPFVQGAASGALLTDADTPEGVIGDAALGGIFGKVGDAVIGGAARLAKPYVSKGAELLRDAGVPMTPGQLMEQATQGGGKIVQTVGSAVRGMEDRLAGLPIIGDAIRPAQIRAIEAYNKAVLNRALAPIGQKIPDDIPAGHEAVKYAGDRLSDGYNKLLPKMKATMDRQFATGLQNVWNDIATLPDVQQKQFADTMQAVFANRAVGFNMSGDMIKEAESKLAQMARDYSKSPDPDQRGLGYALNDALGEFRSLIERNNPKAAPILRALNKGWSELVTAEKAAARQGNAEGVFSPKQYAAEARNADNTARRRATARGERRNQDITDAAANILPNKVPDSGSAGRVAAAGLAGGALGVDPATLAMIGAGTIPYTQMGQRFLNNLLVGQRGPIMSATGDALDQARRLAAPVVAPLVPYLTE